MQSHLVGQEPDFSCFTRAEIVFLMSALAGYAACQGLSACNIVGQLIIPIAPFNMSSSDINMNIARLAQVAADLNSTGLTDGQRATLITEYIRIYTSLTQAMTPLPSDSVIVATARTGEVSPITGSNIGTRATSGTGQRQPSLGRLIDRLRRHTRNR